MTYHVIKVDAVEVLDLKSDIQNLQKQKRSSPYIVDIHSIQMLTSAVAQ